MDKEVIFHYETRKKIEYECLVWKSELYSNDSKRTLFCGFKYIFTVLCEYIFMVIITEASVSESM